MCNTVPIVVAVLARVTADLNQPRGADVLLVVNVPEVWLRQGASLELSLPRLLSCVRCDGGGCDLCERKGAFSKQQVVGGEEPFAITLPTGAGQATGAVQLRLPGLGVRAVEEGLPPGHLLVTVRPNAEPNDDSRSPLVRLVAPFGEKVGLWQRVLSPVGLLVAGTLGFIVLWWILK